MWRWEILHTSKHSQPSPYFWYDPATPPAYNMPLLCWVSLANSEVRPCNFGIKVKDHFSIPRARIHDFHYLSRRGPKSVYIFRLFRWASKMFDCTALSRPYGPAKTPFKQCHLSTINSSSDASSAVWRNHFFIAFMAFIVFIAFIAFMLFIAGASSSTTFFIDFIAFTLLYPVRSQPSWNAMDKK